MIVPPAALTETGGSADVNSLFVNFAKDSDVDLSQTALSSLGNVTSVTMARQYEQRVAPAMNQMRCVAWITVVFAALLAIFMMEIAAADMRGRWRDWKVCRLLGYDSREMTQPLLIEHLLLTVMAAVIGLIAGCILCRRVVGRIVSEVFYIPPKVGMLSCLLVLVLLLILAVFIHRISRIYIGRRPGAGRRKKHNKNKKSKKMKKSKKPKKGKKKEEKSAKDDRLSASGHPSGASREDHNNREYRYRILRYHDRPRDPLGGGLGISLCQAYRAGSERL